MTFRLSLLCRSRVGLHSLAGQPGQTLDVDRAVLLISDALRSPTNRSVALTFTRGSAARPTIDNLSILLKQIVTVSDFDGLIGFYMVDLQTGAGNPFRDQ